MGSIDFFYEKISCQICPECNKNSVTFKVNIFFHLPIIENIHSCIDILIFQGTHHIRYIVFRYGYLFLNNLLLFSPLRRRYVGKILSVPKHQFLEKTYYNLHA